MRTSFLSKETDSQRHHRKNTRHNEGSETSNQPGDKNPPKGFLFCITVVHGSYKSSDRKFIVLIGHVIFKNEVVWYLQQDIVSGGIQFIIYPAFFKFDSIE